MKPSSYKAIGYEQLTSTATTDPQTATLPAGTSAILVTVETTNARMSLTGDDPDATHGHVLAKDAAPVLLTVGPGPDVKFASTAGANSVVNLTYLR